MLFEVFYVPMLVRARSDVAELRIEIAARDLMHGKPTCAQTFRSAAADGDVPRPIDKRPAKPHGSYV